jgi:2,3-bisphosphoglycerate-independent phosphoglycerate mutase
LANSYKNKVTDEFVKPIVLTKNKQDVVVGENDVVIFFNFRSDRARQITSAFMDPDFKEFYRTNIKGLK